MSSLLRPIVLESCQTGFRGRRRSTINPLTIVPQYLADSPSAASEDSAVFDEADQHEIMTTKVESLTEFVVPILSPLSHAHMSDYLSEVAIPRHQNALHMIATCGASSSASTSPHTTLASRKPSFKTIVGKSKPEQVKSERLHWRLASGYFAYFVCGWGDGGKSFKRKDFTISFTSRCSHWHCHPM